MKSVTLHLVTRSRKSGLLETLHAFQVKGITKVRICVDAKNAQGARTLYERVGFREVKQHAFRRKSF
jgi:ribosomal protein S18 acetylase RimI-like enzyme